MNGKNKPVWVLDTDVLTVTHNTYDTEPSVTAFSFDHIKYHLHYSSVPPRRVEKWKATDKEYLNAITVGDMDKANGVENMLKLCAREPVFEAMVYV